MKKRLRPADSSRISAPSLKDCSGGNSRPSRSFDRGGRYFFGRISFSDHFEFVKAVLLLALCALPSAAFAQGRSDPKAREAYAGFGYHPDGYYKSYLALIQRSKLPLPNRDEVGLFGALDKAQNIPFQKDLTVSKALATAGGADHADERHIGIWKNRDGQFVIFDLKALRENKPAAKDIALEAGDIVVVLPLLISF